MASRLRRLFHLIVRPPAAEQQVDDEIRFHLAAQSDELIAQGWPPETARAEAERRFGDRREAARDLVSLESSRRVQAGRAAWWEALRHDLKLALRSLRREPGFTAVAIIALGLGVGLTVAVASVFNAAILRPLPYPNPERLVQVWEHNRPRDMHENLVAPANFLRWRERARSFTGLELYTWDQRTLTDGGGAYRLNGYVVTPGLPALLGVDLALGRPFRPEEAVPGAAPVIVLTDRTWRDRFGADSGVVGRAVPLVEGSATVIGVLAPNTRLLDEEDYWAPFAVTPEHRTPRGRYTMVLGRLGTGVTIDAARAELKQIAAGLESELPEFDKGWGIEAVPLTDQVEGNGRPLVVVMLVAASFLLLIAVANVGNLFLGRALARADDHAVRAALGASLGRLARAWIAEAAVVAVAAGALGAAAAYWLIAALIRLAPPNVPRLNELAFGPVAVVTAAALTVLIGLVIGVLPAWAATRGRSVGTPMLRSLRTTADGSTLRVRDGLVAVQVALSVALLSGSGLLIRSLSHLMRVDPGVRTEGVLSIQLTLPAASFPDGPRQTLFYDALLDRLRATPGISSVGLASFLPIRGFIAGTPFSVEGAPPVAAGEKPSADIQTADSG
ncbi:MAG: ABC transporter permease, partial [Gemmatimonadota bacterium]